MEDAGACNQLATHGLSCKWSQEPFDLSLSDGKRPDRMSVVPWTSGKLLVWDATCTDTYTPSNIGVAVTGAGEVPEKSEQHKISKYSHLDSTYIFIPMACWDIRLGVFGPQALKFIEDLGQRLRTTTDEANSKQYLLQRILVAIQRGNTSSILRTLGQQEGLFWPYLRSLLFVTTSCVLFLRYNLILFKICKLLCSVCFGSLFTLFSLVFLSLFS